MQEPDAVAVLLAREIEQKRLNAWSAADASRAGDEARRVSGENASFEDWLAHRARSITARNTFSELLAAAQLLVSRWSTVATVVIALAFAAGVASDAIGAARRVNILAPPLLALLAWNVAVYVVLALRRLSTPDAATRAGALRRLLAALGERMARAAAGVTSTEGTAVLAGFARAWASSSRALTAARAAAIVHAAAAALVLGALCSMYLRGVALEYRAGWDSTFLEAERVHALLSLVLGPASRVSGIALPDTVQLAALRFSAGPGENAARWIHLYAITLMLVVVLPRTVLAMTAIRRSHRLMRRLPLPLDEPYFESLHRAWSGGCPSVAILPYSYHLNPAQRAALPDVLQGVIAPQIDVRLLETAPLGAEDELSRWLGLATETQVAGQPLLVVLFAATATPEREHHGALMRALATLRPTQRFQALVDESGFRRRFRGDGLAARLEERRRAWRAVMGEAGVEPLFADLDGGADEADTKPVTRPAARDDRS
jgi:hypothetical protein